MIRGYVKIWRKSLDAGWLQNHALWAFWSWCLLKASHKVISVRVGFQEVILQPGEFIFGRQMASKELHLSERTVRSCLDFLKKAGNVTIKTTNKFSVITVVNWHSYQADNSENDQQDDQPAATDKTKNPNRKKSTTEISSEISTLTEKLFPTPDGKELFTKSIEALSFTRKTKKVSPSVILGLLQKFQKYPGDQVMAGMSIYLEKEYFKEGKREEYLFGIIKRFDPTSKTNQKANADPYDWLKRTAVN